MQNVEQFWQQFLLHNGLQNVTYKDAFQFGVEADWLADLVVKGEKTATTSGFVFYEMEQEPIPEAGQYYIVLDSTNSPKAVIQIESVEVMPMNEVSEEFALAEGEGDYDFWWQAHEKFFTEGLAPFGKTFSPSMPVVCERFINVYPK